MNGNPWIDRFELLLDPTELKRRVTITAVPILGLDQMPIQVAKTVLESGMKATYAPSGCALQLMTMVIERALAHSTTKYSSAASYLKGVYAENSPLSPEFAGCITGLAGVGKTQMIKALLRALGTKKIIDVDFNHRGVTMVPAIYVEQRAKSGPVEVLQSVLAQTGYKADVKARKVDGLVRASQRRAFSTGASVLIYDEAQMESLSASANASITHQMLCLRDIGIPLYMVLNYSLLHRIRRRPSEDRQRLLSDVHVMQPAGASSECFLSMLKQYQAVAPSAFIFDMSAHAERIHNFTAGLPRLIVFLFSIAYEIARQEKQRAIGISHLEKAYGSIQYSQNREDVEVIRRHQVNPREVAQVDGTRRFDLYCPFSQSLPDKSEIIEAKRVRDRENATKILTSSLSAEQRKQIKFLERETGAVVFPPAPTRRTPVHRPKTGEQLLANLGAALEEYEPRQRR